MIYHYTSIDALASILKFRKIRFSRLDTVDDPEEYQFVKNGANPAKYIFVSCWTRSSEESIPQWRLYGNNGHGVRIGTDETLFKVIKDDDGLLNIYHEKSDVEKQYTITPLLSNGQLLFDVKYVNNVPSKYDDIFPNEKIVNLERINIKELGIYKSESWAFQRECRFRVAAFPMQRIKGLNYTIRKLKEPLINHIDIEINEASLSNLTITMGPDTTEAEQIIIKTLIDKYAIGDTFIEESAFTRFNFH